MKILLLGFIGFLLLLFDRRPYRRIIKSWSKLFHMKIRYHNRYTELFSVDVMDNILYISRYNKAVHNRQEYLYSIAHEFGHLIDYAAKEFYLEEEDIYNKLTDVTAIYKDEVAAWDVAEVLLQEAKVLEEGAFTKLKEKCLTQYREALKLTTKGKKQRQQKSTPEVTPLLKKKRKSVKRSKITE